ncbi:NAD(P)-dependent oxidoreductase, partial [bacterium]|nr:NAD(P)-dependent oxidoreductase [bacterium]
SGLPNYRGIFHIEENLPESYKFLSAAVKDGYSRLLVVGTCFEYGMQQGCLSETQDTFPTNPYGLAKDVLRKFLEALQHEHPFTLQWCRLFYMYGEGQNPRSLLQLLDAAIERGDKSFPMSGGEQIRDFSPVTEVANRLVGLIERPEATGIFNICSGQPISVRKLVENRIAKAGSMITPELGVYPYPDYEPFAFWGDTSNYPNLKNNND